MDEVKAKPPKRYTMAEFMDSLYWEADDDVFVRVVSNISGAQFRILKSDLRNALMIKDTRQDEPVKTCPALDNPRYCRQCGLKMYSVDELGEAHGYMPFTEEEGYRVMVRHWSCPKVSEHWWQARLGHTEAFKMFTRKP